MSRFSSDKILELLIAVLMSEVVYNFEALSKYFMLLVSKDKLVCNIHL